MIHSGMRYVCDLVVPSGWMTMVTARSPSDFAIAARMAFSCLDAALPVALMKSMQTQVPGSQFAEIKDAGHLSNLEQPEAYNKALLAFLAQQK